MSTTSFKLNDKKVERAWALYDWGNSAYFLVISTAIFPIYFIEYSPEVIDFLGFKIPNSTFYSYAVSFSYLVIMAISPILSGIADHSGKRLLMLKSFTIVGSLSCVLLFFFGQDNNQPLLWLGTSAFILATIGCAGGIVFYNAYLPEIVTKDRYDKVSAKGYAYGYVGSVILLILILVIVLQPGLFGITQASLPYRIGFVMVGLWWLGFASYTFRFLPRSEALHHTRVILVEGYREVSKAFKNVRKDTSTMNFLVSFFFFGAGVNTVIYLATVFAEKELNFESYELIITVLILQLVAVGGAYLFARVSELRGSKFSLAIQILIWFFICVIAYFIQSKAQFFVIAGLVGLVLGGIQSQARSMYTKLIDNKPSKEHTSYFSFYDVIFKGSIVFGTFMYGLVNQITGSMRISVLVLGLFFIIGLLFLLFVRLDERANTIKVS